MKKYLLCFFIMWIFFIFGLIVSIVTTRIIFTNRDYTNSSDTEIIIHLIVKISSMFIIYSIIFINIPSSYRFLSIFPFIFAFVIPLIYVNKNINYIINTFLLKTTNPKNIDTWGKINK